VLLQAVTACRGGDATIQKWEKIFPRGRPSLASSLGFQNRVGLEDFRGIFTPFGLFPKTVPKRFPAVYGKRDPDVSVNQWVISVNPDNPVNPNFSTKKLAAYRAAFAPHREKALYGP